MADKRLEKMFLSFPIAADMTIPLTKLSTCHSSLLSLCSRLMPEAESSYGETEVSALFAELEALKAEVKELKEDNNKIAPLEEEVKALNALVSDACVGIKGIHTRLAAGLKPK